MTIILATSLIFLNSALAATIQGAIYSTNLDVEKDVLVMIDTTPSQKYLAKDGTYSFQVSPGKYVLTAKKGLTEVSEEVEVIKEGEFIYDLFMMSSLTEEDEIWKSTEEDYFGSVEEKSTLAYWVAGFVFLLAMARIIYYRKKYGPIKKFRKKIKEESKKTIYQHKAELAQEPDSADKALEIIKKHDGRISQKKLRKEMLYLSEAKVSLILTELEHKGLIEKVKKGRGNVILLK